MIFEQARHVVGFMASTGAGPALLVLLAGSGVVTWWLRRAGRSERPFALLFAAVASLAAVIVMTLLRESVELLLAVASGDVGLPAPGQVLDWTGDGWERISYHPFSIQVLLNVALFVPAGATWTLMTGRPLRVLAGLLGLTFLVECLQAVTGLGANDVADLLANGVGAGLGVLAGTLGWVLWPGPSGRPRPSRRRAIVVAAAVVALGLVTALGLQWGAQHRQDSLGAELRDRFHGASLQQYRTWEAEDRLTEEVFDAGPVFSDGARVEEGAVLVRWPASFLGVRRCVLVEWTPGAADVRPASGHRCTEFLG